MRILRYVVPAEWEGATVKAFARGYLELSAHALAGQKFPGGIRVNGQDCHVRQHLRAGDVLALSLPPEGADYPCENLPLAVVYEDEDFLIVDKASGMPVHPSPGHDWDSLLQAVSWHYRRTGQSCAVKPLFRLDKDTSGLLAIAKHRIAAGARTRKTYLAVCEGVLSGSGTVDAPIGLAEGSKILRVCGPGPQSQPAVTHWRALAQAEDHTLLALWLETGRTHQIRAHMAWLGHPLAGDDLYGGGLQLVSRQALHCCSLELECRALGLRREFHSPLPEDLAQAFSWARPWGCLGYRLGRFAALSAILGFAKYPADAHPQTPATFEKGKTS
ncbi:RluA family pseudouridine synthase [Acutalibacter sp. 1XD8-33]|uniref:RluA family pseudouridine synthase n=1 Tax=Acutalibacter sp. 1XD8-33 TaxID=2320081 RepID=UPI000EA3C033|nr:RluA family pseudouridine synthase [Acutalibacter sp. 1XD8-33]RKJ40056.1 RluA family pseudouridine synthase [Acutalibacter sp. 1XD8-33]